MDTAGVSSLVTLPPFQTFLDRHRRDLHRFLVSSVGPDAADDCLQETLLAALRAYPGLPGTANVRAWALTIAHRKAIDHHRARARRPVPVAVLPERGGVVAEADRPELWELVRELPPKQRAAVALRYAVDLPHADIGAVLDCYPEAARRNVHQGLKRQREEWAE